MILESLIPALLPVATDGIRGLFNKFTGGAGAKPANTGEVIALMEAETTRLEALAEIDSAASNVHAWVNDVRALQRPVAAGLIVVGYITSFVFVSDADIVNDLGSYAQMVTFYLFGDRTYMYMKKS
ncbi:MAG: hypothetical protein COA96_14195 [SAR86 cluster bacterium]|uniref:Uncharacterized protein n=1 Tax=SAR86 cluster bacterium TaxID=2030880 RepID=A0A2A5AUJ1_9GAMM|nr:MAG: hypothetical protein COA96_14195 [SAR86 cluster bacterium]